MVFPLFILAWMLSERTPTTTYFFQWNQPIGISITWSKLIIRFHTFMHSVQPLEWTGFQQEGGEEKASPHGLPKPTKSTATEALFIEGSQSKRTQFVKALPQESKPKEILEERLAENFMLFFPRFVSEVCFCFRLMLRLGDRVCTRAWVLVQFCMSVWRYWKA